MQNEKAEPLVQKGFQDSDYRALNQAPDPSKCGALCDNPGGMPMKPALVLTQALSISYVNKCRFNNSLSILAYSYFCLSLLPTATWVQISHGLQDKTPAP